MVYLHGVEEEEKLVKRTFKMLDGFGVRHSRAGGYDPFRLAWSTGFAFRPTSLVVIDMFLRHDYAIVLAYTSRSCPVQGIPTRPHIESVRC